MRNLYSMCILSVLSVGYIHDVKAYPAPNPVQCGTVLQGRKSRIINGSVAGDTTFPWVASIKLNGVHMCGGTIISSRYVLSAAHCEIKPEKKWTVTLGEYCQTVNETFSVNYEISHVRVHDDYNKINMMKNDIMLLRLSEEIQWSDHIRPICLPREDVRTSKNAIAAGWGMDNILNSIKDENNQKLRYVNIDIFENEECNEKYAKRKLPIRLHETQMCAGKDNGEIRDTNKGDSGGPLLVELEGRKVIVGITSGSPVESVYPKSPGIYTRVFNYMNWIMRELPDITYYPPISTNKLE